MGRPRLLDLYCCQGGAARGYESAGFDVYGVDRGTPRKGGGFTLGPLRRYPYAHHHGDALGVLGTLLAGRKVAFVHPNDWVKHLGLKDFDAIHASPPCQGYTIATAGNPGARAKHQRLIAATRELLVLTGLPWVIENVEQARDQMRDPTLLCGRMFGLEADDEDGERLVLDRHRLFESNVTLTVPWHASHWPAQVAGVYGGSRRAKWLEGETLAQVAPRDRHAARVERGGGYVPRSIAVQQALLGIDWMTVKGMQESIPPVYAEWVGRQLMAHLDRALVPASPEGGEQRG